MIKLVQSFKEQKEFAKEKPWSAVRFEYGREEICPPHYADTIEILVYDNVEGEAYIGANRFSLSGQKAFFVSPNVVHGFSYRKSEGHVMTLKINPELLNPIFNIEKYLLHNRTDYTKLPIVIDNTERMKQVAAVFASSTNLGDIICEIIALLDILIASSEKSNLSQITDHSENEEIRPIIDWTEHNFKNRITLEDAANHLGYTKEHFCRKFKSFTGMTYLSYLNGARIFHACKLLKSGCSVNKAASECGFDDVSYFIRLFKKIKGVTPKKYASEEV